MTLDSKYKSYQISRSIFLTIQLSLHRDTNLKLPLQWDVSEQN